MNQTSDDQDCTVKKTVYDPCPPGFSIPNRNAFTGTTYGGSHSSSTSDYNVSGSWSNGWTFYTGGWKTEGTFKATAHGWRFRNSGVLDSYGTLHGYMTAGGASGHQALGFTSTSGRVSPQLIHESRASGFPVLPAREH